MEEWGYDDFEKVQRLLGGRADGKDAISSSPVQKEDVGADHSQGDFTWYGGTDIVESNAEKVAIAMEVLADMKRIYKIAAPQIQDIIFFFKKGKEDLAQGGANFVYLGSGLTRRETYESYARQIISIIVRLFPKLAVSSEDEKENSSEDAAEAGAAQDEGGGAKSDEAEKQEKGQEIYAKEDVKERDGKREDVEERDGKREDVGERDGKREDVGERDGKRKDVEEEDEKSIARSGHQKEKMPEKGQDMMPEKEDMRKKTKRKKEKKKRKNREKKEVEKGGGEAKFKNDEVVKYMNKIYHISEKFSDS